MTQSIYLGINVDHVATVRQARGGRYPDPVHAALQAELAGADGITMHLREDRRHIQDHDIQRYAASLQTRLNFEMAATDAMRDLALTVAPRHVCLVPEKREELTTEGGLDVAGRLEYLTELCTALREAGITVSMFIDPDEAQIEASVRAGAPAIELHTGRYADAPTEADQAVELEKIDRAALIGSKLGLTVNAGHGLHYQNVQAVARIGVINELNIGHSVIARALLTGLPEAVSTLKRLMVEARYA